ncbi:spore coat protein [Paenibacillus sp. MBLB4367]|uniref:spore coat protein n=1 Tax=Paenibacillus sp. MBLB4367 TaxID=3384767 RepID=UPI00390806FA
MPYGAHETMEVHEMLNEKTNLINLFSMYLQDCQNVELRQLIERHISSAIADYDQLVAYTHDYSAAMHIPQAYAMPHAEPQHIMYGLHQPAPQAPQTGGRLDDRQIVSSMLCMHKSSAKNHMSAALECADPNVRQMLLNGSHSCANQAYEVFLFMNRQGLYQVPTMQEHTAKTYLHSYQPFGHAVQPQASILQPVIQPVLQPIRQPAAQSGMAEEASSFFDGANAPMNNLSQAVAQSMMSGPYGAAQTSGGMNAMMHPSPTMNRGAFGNPSVPAGTFGGAARPMQGPPSGSGMGFAPGAPAGYSRPGYSGSLQGNSPGRLQ